MRAKTTKTSIFFGTLLLSLNLSAQDSGFEVNKFSSIQKFYYNLGRNRSKQEFYSQGYSDAVRDFKKLLKSYEARIKKLEAGKYLIESGKITYPEVYKTRDSHGGYKIHIEAPVVEREFTAEDLFIVPLVDSNMARNAKIAYPNEPIEEGNGFSDSFFIPSMSNEVRNNVPKTPKEAVKKVYVDIRYKSSSIKEFLDNYNATYSVSDNGYRVEFNSESEKRKFCTDLTGEASCYGLN